MSDHKIFKMHNKFLHDISGKFLRMKPSFLITNAGLMVKGSFQTCIIKKISGYVRLNLISSDSSSYIKYKINYKINYKIKLIS